MEQMEKTERFVQLKNLATSVISCWSILSVPVEEKLNFMPLLHYAKAGSVDDIPESFASSEDFMKIVENECNRLQKVVTDLILRKKSKLQQIYQKSHLESPFSEEGSSDVNIAFEQVKKQISIAKAVSMERQDIVTRVELLESACDEIQWYVSPNYNASIEDHERATRGKMLVDFFPKMLEELKDKVGTWNLEKEMPFSFDGVDVSQRIEALEAFYKEKIKAGMDAVPVGIDIHHLVVPRQPRTPRIPAVPRQPRTPRIPVQVNVPPPPPQPQVPPPSPPPQPSDDISMASSGSQSDPKDSDYHPSGSDASE